MYCKEIKLTFKLFLTTNYVRSRRYLIFLRQEIDVRIFVKAHIQLKTVLLNNSVFKLQSVIKHE